ncbi:right-handed parallel beta-helix repeat-containing protein [Kibdelosporangium phytohabitans]|uniref:Right handed beta helix domain-containing protein n=1 Tax=Kibdelosporangium phytohabitans TaxID=860235 RepID=A0A0N7F4R2_9PSEU|nr:right-handed parallel beta-helix repeat-containing protein [Kibdelosporangium phytohabitans]ALG12143.1 hypothetical protein AOZ06_39490 [Kibdelosporangium phytohabitans]MBE1463654.1 hypothetical protein [Kibdelosporangium phytohabitans]
MADPAVLLVGVKGYADVGSALRFARPGDVIEIAPGTYDGEVVVDKAVEVRPKRGAGTVTLTAATGNTLMVLADATVRDLTVVGSGWNWAAVEVVGQGVNPKISNCDIRAPHSVGVRVRGGASPAVADCRIGPASQGLRVEAAKGFYKRCTFSDVLVGSVIAKTGASPTVLNCAFDGPGRQAAVATDHGTVLTLGECEIAGGSVTATEGGHVAIADCAIHGGGPALEIADGGVLHARNIRIAGTSPEGILISGGNGVFTDCRITGTHGPAVWMTDGEARFERCEAIDSDRAGFLVVGGAGEFLGCVAHNNADQGFSIYTAVELTECGSYGNGRPDDVGSRNSGFGVSGGTATFAKCAAEDNRSRGFEAFAETTSTACRSVDNDLEGEIDAHPDGPAQHVVRVRTYAQLKQAFHNASPGDTVELEPGMYRCVDQIRIPAGVEVRPAAASADSVRLIAKRNHPVVISDAATLRDITVHAEYQTAVTITGAGNSALLDGCKITAKGGIAVKVVKGATPTLRDCRIGPAQEGLVVRDAGGHYERCTVTATPEPVVVSNSVGLEFSDCVVKPKKGKRVSVSGMNPPLTLTGNRLMGTVQAGRHATVRAG